MDLPIPIILPNVLVEFTAVHSVLADQPHNFTADKQNTTSASVAKPYRNVKDHMALFVLQEGSTSRRLYMILS